MSFNRFNRAEFYKIENTEGVEEFDFTTFSLADFNFNREKSFLKITEADLLRPDLIAIKAYGDLQFQNVWWIIMYVNDIHDIWNDLQIGDILTIPNRKDLEELISFNRKTRNSD